MNHSKGQVLQSLIGKLSSSQILPLLLIKRGQIANLNFPSINDNITKRFGSTEKFAIRSSFVNEDTHFASNAGAYLTLLDVSIDEISRAVELVFDSNDNPDSNDEVLIQPMLEKVVLSGVVITFDRATMNNYRIVQYTLNQDTTLVTSGKLSNSISKVYWKDFYRISNDVFLNSIGEMVDELELVLENDQLDIEFAFVQGRKNPYLLQVRPLIIQSESKDKTKLFSIDQYLDFLENKLKVIFKKHPFLAGDSTILGIMPDWNPAEIIGIRPKPLALSLYRELITDSMWAYQRHNYGYRNLRSFPLMIDLGGQPYIDVRTSFNSFIPEELPEPVAKKLVNGYLEKLQNHPELHDKVEFEIVISCLTLNFNEKVHELKSYGLNKREVDLFRESLKQITKNIFTEQTPIWQIDKVRTNQLGPRRDKILNSQLAPLEKIYWLIEDCKRYGTLPFGGLARAAFVSTQLLNSIESVGLIDHEQRNLINKSVKTIATEISSYHRTQDKEKFFKNFGHLRPGTYDITQPSYKDSPDIYFSNLSRENREVMYVDSGFNIKDLSVNFKEIENHLKTIGVNLSAQDFFDVVIETIRLRESSKLEFTKNLSIALDLTAEYGGSLGFSRDDLSYLNFDTLKSAHLSSIEVKPFFDNVIARNMNMYKICKSIWLPSLIKSEKDIYSFELGNNVANFIGQKCIQAKISLGSTIENISNSIVLIENADPGYDWIFSSPIKGLITAYGGLNSHMAVRAGEFGLPCAIGIGQERFNELKTAHTVRLDCLNQMITILS